MPEEHNRVIIDHIADHLYATGENAAANLRREAVRGRVYITGNTIVDASVQHLQVAQEKSTALEEFGLAPGEYGILTTHREENVDVAENLRGALEGVARAAMEMGVTVLFLAHPRTLKRLDDFGLRDWAASLDGLRVEEGAGYLDFIKLVAHARVMFTDSGGVQQEACIHRVPCVTLRENTEWTETLDIGANRLAGCDPERIVAAAREAASAQTDWEVPFGDGHAAQRIVDAALDETAGPPQ